MTIRERYYGDPHGTMQELLDLFSTEELKLYGISLKPRDMQKLRHNIMKMNKTVEEMQE